MPVHDPRLMHTIGPEFPTQSFPQHATSTPDHQRRHSDGESKLKISGPTLVIPTQVKESGPGDHAAGGDGVTINQSTHQHQSPSTPHQIPVTIQILQSPDTSQQQRTSQQTAPISDSPTQRDSKLNTSYRSETVNTAVGSSPPLTPARHHFDEQGLPLLLDELGAFKDKNKVVSVMMKLMHHVYFLMSFQSFSKQCFRKVSKEFGPYNSDPKLVEESLNRDLSSTKSWADKWKISFEPSKKCKVMTISRKRTPSKLNLYFVNCSLVSWE